MSLRGLIGKKVRTFFAANGKKGFSFNHMVRTGYFISCWAGFTSTFIVVSVSASEGALVHP